MSEKELLYLVQHEIGFDLTTFFGSFAVRVEECEKKPGPAWIPGLGISFSDSHLSAIHRENLACRSLLCRETHD